jgi:hypothetical protein
MKITQIIRQTITKITTIIINKIILKTIKIIITTMKKRSNTSTSPNKNKIILMSPINCKIRNCRMSLARKIKII